MQSTHSPISLLAPTGMLRAAINLANPVLAARGVAGAQASGVSVDLAREFAAWLGCKVTLVEYGGAGSVVEAAGRGEWDVAFLAVEPARMDEIWFSSPYVLIEGTYIVHKSSGMADTGDVDRPGNRIAVARRAAYDLFLTRQLRHAEMMRFETPETSFAGFVEARLAAAAGIRQALDRFAADKPDLLVCQGRFLTIEQAMALPRANVVAAPVVESFIKQRKANGFVRRALDAHGHMGVLVAGQE